MKLVVDISCRHRGFIKGIENYLYQSSRIDSIEVQVNKEVVEKDVKDGSRRIKRLVGFALT